MREDDWISVDERLPDHGSVVMTWNDDYGYGIESISNYDLAVLRGEEYSQTSGQFSSWQPLPPPPKTTKSDPNQPDLFEETK